jgi:hypothetical protein
MSNTVMRPGFCLGCGSDTGPVAVEDISLQPPPMVPHPSWCLKGPCRVARVKFRALTDQILSEGYTTRPALHNPAP